jgi:hypothetical protein
VTNCAMTKPRPRRWPGRSVANNNMTAMARNVQKANHAVRDARSGGIRDRIARLSKKLKGS